VGPMLHLGCLLLLSWGHILFLRGWFRCFLSLISLALSEEVLDVELVPFGETTACANLATEIFMAILLLHFSILILLMSVSLGLYSFLPH